MTDSDSDQINAIKDRFSDRGYTLGIVKKGESAYDAAWIRTKQPVGTARTTPGESPLDAAQRALFQLEEMEGMSSTPDEG